MYDTKADSSNQRSLFRRCALRGAVIISLLAQALGCGSVDDGSDVGIATPPLSEVGDVQPGAGDPEVDPSCKADTDCKTVALNCDECSCGAFVKDASAPKCPAGNAVSCVIDPCRGKSAVCTAGQCVVSDEW